MSEAPTTWEQRMSLRAGERQAARAAAARRVRDEEEAAARAACEAELGPTPCGVCYALARDSWTPGRWQWVHVWPHERFEEAWTCTHDCHGPGGELQVPVAIG